MKIAIFGASGFLGTKLMNMLSEEFQVIGADRNGTGDILNVDATNNSQVKSFILEQKPEFIINTIALTSSIACEKDPKLAEILNYNITKNILETSELINAKVMLISSSYLFDGKKGNYSEKDYTNPLNVYGKTKLLAEKEILSKGGIVVRVDIMYGFNSNEGSNGVFDKILSNKPIEIRDPNQIRSPVFIDDVVRAISFLIKNKEKGIFHLAGKDYLDMLTFLKKLEFVFRDSSKIVIINSPEEIKIPSIATLNSSKSRNLGIKFHSFEEALTLIKEKLNNS